MDFQGNPSLLIFVYICFPETPDFWCFPFPENSGLLWTPVDWFLRVPCYSGMFVFRDIWHMYYVPLSLVNLSTVDSFHISWIPQFPLCPTLLFSLMSSQIFTCISFQFSEPLVYIFPVVCNITLELRLLCLPCSTCPLFDLPPTCFPRFWKLRKLQSPEFPCSLILGNPGSLRDSTGNRAIPWVRPSN